MSLNMSVPDTYVWTEVVGSVDLGELTVYENNCEFCTVSAAPTDADAISLLIGFPKYPNLESGLTLYVRSKKVARIEWYSI